MGMSASQARYLNLVARQNDLEFQGQQINQSRTTLSDQTNNLYSQLQNLDVPTPPVTNDYTKIVYTTADGPTKYNLGQVRPSTKKEGAYNLDLQFQTVGDSLQKSMTSSSISYSDAELLVSEVKPEMVKTGDYVDASVVGVDPEFYVAGTSTPVKGSELPEGAKASDYVKVDNGNYVSAGSTIEPEAMYIKKTTVDEYNAMGEAEKDACNGYVEAETQSDIIISPDQLADYYVQIGDVVMSLSDTTYTQKQEDGSFKVNLPEGAKLFKEGGTQTIKNPKPNKLLIGGNEALTYEEAKAKYPGDAISWVNFEKGIKNTFGEDAKLTDFYYVITTGKTGALDVQLFRTEDVPTTPEASKGMTAPAYTYTTGTYTATQNKDYVELEFDSTGRISQITIPTEYDANGEPVAWKKLPVTSKSETDNEAYEEAMTKYEYAKYQYDKEQTEINAQMSIIQAQDKKLELKLQRLDHERTQITTELEALKKVVTDDIESSYKTFSG